MDIPEIVVLTLGHLELRDRELARRVCHSWNYIASGHRGLLEVEVYPMSREFTHLGVAVGDSRYLKYVETQEDFDKLWPFYRCKSGVLPNPRFVTREVLEAVDRSAGDKIYIWFIRLDYEIMKTVECGGVGRSFSTDCIAGELIRQSGLGILDPRKVMLILDVWGVHLWYRMPGTRHLSDIWNSQLLLMATVCPEVALYYWLVEGKTLLPKDAVAGPELIGEKLYSTLRTPGYPTRKVNPDAFAKLCEKILKG